MRPIQLFILTITFALGCAASVMTSHLVEASREEGNIETNVVRADYPIDVKP